MANLELTVHGNQSQLVPVEKTVKKLKREVDDSRRDEWSSEAINSLLDVYEAKWNYRSRGNLKGGDWEDVAARVSARCAGTKTPKTPFQCKNKVASMKQKYRSETLLKGINGSATSRWPYFVRMDLMLRVPSRDDEGTPPDGGITGGGVQIAITDLRLQEAIPQVDSGDSEQEVMRRDQGIFQGVPLQKFESRGEFMHNRDSNQEDASNTLPHRKLSAANDSDTSTPRSKAAHTTGISGKPANNRDRKLLSREIAASIRSFADSILKLEQAKMEMFKDSERLRAELEARRVDMELKRTEIIMSTQLQIAKLLSGNSRKRKVRKAANTACVSPSGRGFATTTANAARPPLVASIQSTLPIFVGETAHAGPSSNGVLSPPVPVQPLPCTAPKPC